MGVLDLKHIPAVNTGTTGLCQIKLKCYGSPQQHTGRRAGQAVQALRQPHHHMLCWDDAKQPVSPAAARPPGPSPKGEEQNRLECSKETEWSLILMPLVAILRRTINNPNPHLLSHTDHISTCGVCPFKTPTRGTLTHCFDTLISVNSFLYVSNTHTHIPSHAHPPRTSHHPPPHKVYM